MAGSRCATDFLVAWSTAEMSFMAPEIVPNVVSPGRLQISPYNLRSSVDAVKSLSNLFSL